LRPLSAGRLGTALLLCLPALLTAYFAFTGGGFFAGSTGVAAVLVWVGLGLRMVAAERPTEGISWRLAAVAGALALLTVWTLVSTAWSDSAARGLIEFDRALLYLGVLLLFGSLPRRPGQIEWALRALLLAFAAVGAVALTSRVLPEVLTTSNDIAAERLSYPLTYWNGLGLLLGLGAILALHFASSEREPAWMRVLGAGAAPVLASGLYFTLSRGAIAVTIVGAVGYLLLARPRGAPAGLLAVLPACTLAVVAGYHADLLSTNTPTSAAAVAQGKDAALVIGLSVVLALVVRSAGLMLDRRLGSVRVTPRARRAAWAGVAAAALLALAVAWLALDLGDRIQSQYDGFVSGTSVKTGGDVRSRLTEPGNNGRLDHWRVALDAFEKEPFLGTGAGTYGITWARDRPITLKVEDAHSLYIELLSELGLPGLFLALVAIVLVLLGFGRAVRGPDRHLHAALFAAGGAWAVHAGIDWDWEMPAVTVWFWAFGGMALAAPAAEVARAAPANLMRVVVAIACLVLAVTPALMAVSQARLNDAVTAFKRGDCNTAINAALGSLKAMPSRPQPFEVLGFCDSKLGEHGLAAGAMRSGLDRDPDNWELYYGLALVRANAELDPRSAARRALRLNPRGELPRRAVRSFATQDPQKWKRRAQRARLPIR
jgi:O-antigen ligase